MRHQAMASPAAFALALVTSLAAAAMPAAAQRAEPSLGYLVRVTAAEAPIFAQADARSPLVGRARSGDTLVVLGKENAWYKVRIPRDRMLRPNGPASGYVEARIVAITGPGAALGPAETGRPAPARRAAAAGRGPRVFGEVAVQAFAATETFKAIFDSPVGFFFGGGADLAVGRSLRVGGSVTHFQKTGERAFAHGGESFRLGVADRVSITPIAFNLTYRFNRKGFTPYLGGGAGVVLYRETSDYANADDNVKKTGTAFQGLAGVEFAVARRVAFGIEGQYQSIGGILGEGGVSKDLNEKDLGGASLRVRIILGL